MICPSINKGSKRKGEKNHIYFIFPAPISHCDIEQVIKSPLRGPAHSYCCIRQGRGQEGPEGAAELTHWQGQ